MQERGRRVRTGLQPGEALTAIWRPARVHRGFILKHENQARLAGWTRNGGGRPNETFLDTPPRRDRFGTVSTLAMMNNACKSSPHQWCASQSTLRHHVETGRS